MTMRIAPDAFDMINATSVSGPEKNSVAARLLYVLQWPMRVAEARQVARALGGMSEHELRDIGLIGQDVRNVTALPLDADPSRQLVFAREGLRGAR